MNIRALLGSLLVGFFGGLANLLVDIPSIWNYDWNNGLPTYRGLIETAHRYLHTPIFCLCLSICIWGVLIALTDGLFVDLRMGDKTKEGTSVQHPANHIPNIRGSNSKIHTDEETKV